MTQACLDCGTQNLASNHFCIRCGQTLSPQSSTISATEVISPDAKNICEGCRTINEPISTYCYRCGLKLPDQLHTRNEVIGTPGGFWIRLLAYIIDNMLLTIAGLLLTVILTGVDAEETVSQLIGESTNWTATVVTLGMGAAYFTFSVGRWGQTIGKAMLGLKVTRTDGSPLTYWRSFARHWAYFASTIPLGLGFLAIALGSQKRGWHDLLCDTRVVNLRS